MSAEEELPVDSNFEEDEDEPDAIVVPFESVGEAPLDDVTEEDDDGDAGPQGIEEKKSGRK